MSNDLNVLVGKKILAVNLSPDMYYIQFKTEGKDFDFECHGDCCAHAYIATIQNVECLIGQEVTAVLAEESSHEDYTFQFVDNVFYSINTSKGSCHMDFRVEHNGYYGGDLILRDSLAVKWIPAKDTQ